jgi:hypothetical protein
MDARADRTKAFALFLVILLFCATGLNSQQAGSETAVSAGSFVDNIGVNIHLHHADTPYGDFAKVRQAIEQLGIHHIRDGLIDTTWKTYYDRLNELGRLGVKATLITSPKQGAALLSAYPQRVADAFEAYEAPNEYDQSGDAEWATTLRVFLPTLYKAVKTNPATRAFPIVGPSLTKADSYEKLAGAQQYFDYANLHNYMGGRNPGTPGWGANGYGSYQWNIGRAAHAWPGKPIITTETGYFNDSAKPQSVPENVAAKYISRLLFEQTLHGIRRTFIYELVDTGHAGQAGDTTFGLLHADFSPKPAFLALQNVLRLLADPGPEFHAGKFDFVLSGEMNNVHHLLLEKRDGTFYLVIWIEQPSFDVNSRKSIAVGEQSVAVQLAAKSVEITHYQLREDGQRERREAVASGFYKFKVNDCLTILQFSRPGNK